MLTRLLNSPNTLFRGGTKSSKNKKPNFVRRPKKSRGKKVKETEFKFVTGRPLILSSTVVAFSIFGNVYGTLALWKIKKRNQSILPPRFRM